MRRKVPVNGRVWMMVIALVRMLRRKHGSRAHDPCQRQDNCYSDRPKHRRDYGLGCLDGQRRVLTHFHGEVAHQSAATYSAAYGQFQPRS